MGTSKVVADIYVLDGKGLSLLSKETSLELRLLEIKIPNQECVNTCNVQRHECFTCSYWQVEGI